MRVMTPREAKLVRTYGQLKDLTALHSYVAPGDSRGRTMTLHFLGLFYAIRRMHPRSGAALGESRVVKRVAYRHPGMARTRQVWQGRHLLHCALNRPAVGRKNRRREEGL